MHIPLNLVLMKLCLYPPIPHPVNFQFKPQARTVHNHFQSEVKIVKLNPPCCGQTSKQTSWNRIQVRRQSTHVNQVPRIRCWWLIGIAGYQVVRNN